MKVLRSSLSSRGFIRLALVLALVLAGLMSAVPRAGAVGDVVIDSGGSGGSFAIGDTVYVTSDTLNVRSGPGTGYTVIDVIVYGTNGLIIDGPVSSGGYTWYEIDYVGGTSDGWVAGAYLGLVSTGGFAIGDTVSVTSDYLNVRSGPGTGYTVIDLLTYGDQGIVIDGPVSADGFTWYEIQYGGGKFSGWVAGEYLAYVASGGFAIGDVVYVYSDTLNVRSGPGTGYTITDVLAFGDTGTIIDGPVYADGYTWYELSYGGGAWSGWVAGDYLAYVSGGFAIGDSVYVASTSLNVRSGPGTGYTIDDVLPYGATAIIVDGPIFADGYTWYEIEYSDPLYGWVAGEYLDWN